MGKIKLKRRAVRRPRRARRFDDLPMEQKRMIADKIKKVTAQLDPDYQEAAHD